MTDPKDEAQNKLSALSSKVPDGSQWQHYKGGKYTVLTVCLKENNLEPLIIYRSHNYGTVWARDEADWFGTVTLDVGDVPRFQRMDG